MPFPPKKKQTLAAMFEKKKGNSIDKIKEKVNTGPTKNFMNRFKGKGQ